MSQNHTDEFEEKKFAFITYKSITDEYGVSKASQSKWCREFSKECQIKAEAVPKEPNEMDLTKENRHLCKELEDSKKEVTFLKRQPHSLHRCIHRISASAPFGHCRWNTGTTLSCWHWSRRSTPPWCNRSFRCRLWTSTLRTSFYVLCWLVREPSFSTRAARFWGMNLADSTASIDVLSSGKSNLRQMSEKRFCLEVTTSISTPSFWRTFISSPTVLREVEIP